MSGKKISRKKRNGFVQDGKLDITFLSLILILLTVGLVMLFSASYAYSYENYGNSYRFILRQSGFAALGLVVMFACSKIDYHFWRKCTWLVFGAAIFLLIVLLILPPMVSGMDVKRWIVIGPLNFQPSEVAKFALILVFSTLIAANQKMMNKPS
ncbi:MAG: FtsW/RodA/SpoVE family cell cycle protein, partial [Clostridia bacterium]|nr:FtsW/RodA/SpoVE family cell cycle protein [Clostridia bacterium]